MSEKIYLKVPSEPAADEVAIGNFSAKLTPKEVITVENRRFADWLVNEWGCAEVDSPVGSRQSAEGSEEEEPKAQAKKNGGNK